MKITICFLALLVIGEWGVVFFKYNQGGYFHLALALALFALINQLLANRKM
ncbi:hypothetical protein [Fluviicola sp.]|uniref:hypothetical protein n=1 Tax=Fluviicola sp. TaxID=1917219 RepID=UPI0031E22136